MKILLANKYFYPKGGAENSFFQTAALLERKEHKVSFFSMQHPRNIPSKYKKYFVSNIDYETKNWISAFKQTGKLLYSFESRKSIGEILEKENPAIAHLNNIYHQISPSIIHELKKQRIPIVMSLRDYKLVCGSYSMLLKGDVCEACKGGSYFNCFLNKCVKNSRAKSLLNTVEMYLHHKLLKIYDLVDVFISPSRFLRDKVKEMGFERKVEYLPNFISLEDYRADYAFESKTICYLGRLSEEKGVPTLIKAVKGLDVTLKVIGDGPLKENLENSSKKDGQKNVQFLGYKTGEELKNEIRESMFLVIPSEWYENNPRSVIEAFGLGKPVVGARIGGIPELVEDNVTGLTFESGNAEDLRSKIEELAGSPDKVIEMGENARSFVEKELNSEKHYEKLMEIYASIINK